MARAETVKAYLAARAISAPISTAGRGASAPVVQCPGAVPNAALAACLQPNRRVEIEVRGVRRER